ncbi:MAG: MjaI family restriction endonuclease [Halobacteriales archaeon]
MTEEVRISEEERERLVTGRGVEFPKYTTQLLNPANQNAQSTRPKVVGQMSEIISEFQEKHPNETFEDWVEFYYSEYNGEERLEEASNQLFDMVEKMRENIEKIDEEMCREYVEDLVLYQTYRGFDIQEAILSKLSEIYEMEYQRSSAEEESRGIDGYIGEQPISIKPVTYKDNLQEDIAAPIVFYEEYSSSDALKIDLSQLKEALDDTTPTSDSNRTLGDYTSKN